MLRGVSEDRVGNIRIRVEEKPAGHTATTATIRTAIMGGQPMVKVRFDFETSWHVLEETEDGQAWGIWMTDSPAEQMQAWALLKGMSGRVLVGGLGLGLAIRILQTRCPDVNEIVVVEKNADVINLMLRQAPWLDTVEIINADLKQYLKMSGAGPFDWAYIDIWAPDSLMEFMETTAPIRRDLLKKGWVKTRDRIRCWNEDVMRGQMISQLASSASIALHGTPEMLKSVPSLDEMAKMDDDKWWGWSAPFFRMLKRKRTKPSVQDLERLARHWVNRWEMS